ncbi:MAG: AMP-binding protein, partial [Solimonas sp.]
MSADASLNSGLLSRFEQLTTHRAEHVAIEDDREKLSFGELGIHARRVAKALQDRGLQGKRIAMLVTQSARWVETFYGIVLASGVVVPLSHLHPENEQRYFVEASDAEALIVSDEFRGSISSYSPGRTVLSIDEMRHAG